MGILDELKKFTNKFKKKPAPAPAPPPKPTFTPQTIPQSPLNPMPQTTGGMTLTTGESVLVTPSGEVVGSAADPLGRTDPRLGGKFSKARQKELSQPAPPPTITQQVPTPGGTSTQGAATDLSQMSMSQLNEYRKIDNQAVVAEIDRRLSGRTELPFGLSDPNTFAGTLAQFPLTLGTSAISGKETILTEQLARQGKQVSKLFAKQGETAKEVQRISQELTNFIKRMELRGQEILSPKLKMGADTIAAAEGKLTNTIIKEETKPGILEKLGLKKATTPTTRTTESTSKDVIEEATKRKSRIADQIAEESNGVLKKDTLSNIQETITTEFVDKETGELSTSTIKRTISRKALDTGTSSGTKKILKQGGSEISTNTKTTRLIQRSIQSAVEAIEKRPVTSLLTAGAIAGIVGTVSYTSLFWAPNEKNDALGTIAISQRDIAEQMRWASPEDRETLKQLLAGTTELLEEVGNVIAQVPVVGFVQASIAKHKAALNASKVSNALAEINIRNAEESETDEMNQSLLDPFSENKVGTEETIQGIKDEANEEFNQGRIDTETAIQNLKDERAGERRKEELKQQKEDAQFWHDAGVQKAEDIAEVNRLAAERGRQEAAEFWRQYKIKKEGGELRPGLTFAEWNQERARSTLKFGLLN